MRVRVKNFMARRACGEAVRPVFIVMLCFAGLAVAGYLAWQRWNGNLEPAPAEASAPKTRPSETASITLPKSALTNDAVRGLIAPWLRQAWQADGLGNPALDLIPPDRWKPFVTAAIAEELDGPEKVSRVRLNSMATDLAVEAEKHPVAAAVVGHVLPPGETRARLLKIAAEALSKQPGAETLAWHAAGDVALAPEPEDSLAGNRAIEALRKALAATEGFGKDHDQLAAFHLMHGGRSAFFEQRHEDFWHRVEETPGVKKWIKLWVEGLHHVRAGWDARGGGYSNTVSTRGWKVFDEELAKARTNLEAAWKEKPLHAGPAVALITASMNQKEKSLPAMRKWFDEAVKVHADNEEAYRAMLWGMRPRWHGSHALMQSFGEQCLKTARFDTDAPWFFAVAHADCASEWDLPDYYFREFSKRKQLAELIDGYEASPARVAWRSHDRSHAAVWNFKCGQYVEAQRWLEKLDFKPNERVLEDWGALDREFFVGKTAAYASATGTSLRDAELAEEKFNAAKARDLYREGMNTAKNLPESGRRFLVSRIAMMDAEARWKAGEAFLPRVEDNFAGWSQVGEGWRMDGTVIEHTGSKGSTGLTHGGRIGPRFEWKGEIEMIEPGQGAETWISFGYPPPVPRSRWGAVRLVTDGKVVRAVLSTGLGEPEHQSELEIAPKYAVVLQVSGERINLTVNGRKIWDGVIQVEAAVRENYGLFGIGCSAASGKTRVRFGNVTVHKGW